jgi:hypothetical protein
MAVKKISPDSTYPREIREAQAELVRRRAAQAALPGNNTDEIRTKLRRLAEVEQRLDAVDVSVADTITLDAEGAQLRSSIGVMTRANAQTSRLAAAHGREVEEAQRALDGLVTELYETETAGRYKHAAELLGEALDELSATDEFRRQLLAEFGVGVIDARLTTWTEINGILGRIDIGGRNGTPISWQLVANRRAS